MSHDLPAGSRVVLLDSSSVLKSCFEGYQATRTSQWNGRAMDVAGLYGYLYRTMKIYETFEFEALVHVMDPPGGSHHRYSIYPEYKAGRKPEDPLLAAQKALMEPMLRAFGERYCCHRGLESDDVLATLAEQLADAGHQVMILTPDKDLLQLVSDGRISVARYVDNPGALGKTWAIYEEKEVLDAMGVRADQVADFLALVGDASDNIPGVFKCGPKTAMKWLADHGDLATLMTRAHEIKGKVGENLREALERLPLYQRLTNVMRDLPGVALPPVPEPDDELHATMRQALALPDTFPARFRCGGAHAAPSAAQAQAPAQPPRPDGLPTAPAPSAQAPVAASAPAAPSMGRPRSLPGGAGRQAVPSIAPAAPEGQAPVRNPDGLIAPAGDALAASRPQAGKQILGEVFSGQDPASGQGGTIDLLAGVEDPFAAPVEPAAVDPFQGLDDGSGSGQDTIATGQASGSRPGRLRR